MEVDEDYNGVFDGSIGARFNMNVRGEKYEV